MLDELIQASMVSSCRMFRNAVGLRGRLEILHHPDFRLPLAGVEGDALSVGMKAQSGRCRRRRPYPRPRCRSCEAPSPRGETRQSSSLKACRDRFDRPWRTADTARPASRPARRAERFRRPSDGGAHAASAPWADMIPRLSKNRPPFGDLTRESQFQSVGRESQVRDVRSRWSAIDFPFTSRGQVALKDAGRFIGKGEAGTGKNERLPVGRLSAPPRVRLGIARKDGAGLSGSGIDPIKSQVMKLSVDPGNEDRLSVRGPARNPQALQIGRDRKLALLPGFERADAEEPSGARPIREVGQVLPVRGKQRILVCADEALVDPGRRGQTAATPPDRARPRKRPFCRFSMP